MDRLEPLINEKKSSGRMLRISRFLADDGMATGDWLCVVSFESPIEPVSVLRHCHTFGQVSDMVDAALEQSRVALAAFETEVH